MQDNLAFQILPLSGQVVTCIQSTLQNHIHWLVVFLRAVSLGQVFSGSEMTLNYHLCQETVQLNAVLILNFVFLLIFEHQ